MFRIAAFAAATLSLSLLLPASAAQAGTPYWCVCQGVHKRFIASTHYCEVHKYELANGEQAEIPAGWVKAHACTLKDHKRWQKEACAEMRCALPKH